MRTTTAPRRAVRCVVLVAVAFTLMGSGCGSRPPASMTFGDVGYTIWGEAWIPDADLTEIGQASRLDADLVSDPAVFAVREVDPAALVAMRLTAAAMRGAEGEPARPGNVALFVATDTAELPAGICRYFDPRAESSPPECQSTLLVELDGRRYIPIESVGDPMNVKAGADTFAFLPTDLSPRGTIAELDPRLGQDVDTTARSIRGVDPNEVIVLVRGDGLSIEYLVLVTEGTTETPAALCPYVAPHVWRDPGAAEPIAKDERAPRGCVEPKDDPAVEILDAMTQHHDLFFEHGFGDAVHTYRIAFTCFCPPDRRGPFVVRASHNDGLIEVRRGDEVLADDDPIRSWLGRLGDMFDYVRLYARSDRLAVRYDPTYGFPVELLADPDAASVDDEFGFTVSDLTIGR